MTIHSTAVISPTAKIGKNTRIGPFCVVDGDVEIGDDCDIAGRVTIKSGTKLGSGNEVLEGSVLGGKAQHTRAPLHSGGLVIGSGNTIRENVTIHRALHAGENTVVGDNCLIMISSHIGHDCKVGSQVILANNVLLAGHVEVDDRAYLSGAVCVHQFCRVGPVAMVGGQAHVVKDVPPYVTVDGVTTLVVGLNLVGLKRAGFTEDQIHDLKGAYRLIYRRGLPWAEVMSQLALEFPDGVAAIYGNFFSGGRRGFTSERRAPRRASLQISRPAPEEAAEPAKINRYQAKAG